VRRGRAPATGRAPGAAMDRRRAGRRAAIRRRASRHRHPAGATRPRASRARRPRLRVGRPRGSRRHGHLRASRERRLSRSLRCSRRPASRPVTRRRPGRSRRWGTRRSRGRCRRSSRLRSSRLRAERAERRRRTGRPSRGSSGRRSRRRAGSGRGVRSSATGGAPAGRRPLRVELRTCLGWAPAGAGWAGERGARLGASVRWPPARSVRGTKAARVTTHATRAALGAP